MKAIKKTLKFLLWTVLALVALALAALLTHPLWLGPVVKGVANGKVPEITGTAFNLGEFGLNLYRGKLHVGDVQLQNPARFFTASEKTAKSLSDVKGDGLLGTVAAHAGNALSAAGDAVNATLDAVTSSETNAVSLGSLDVSFSTMSALSDTVHIGEIAIRDLYFYGDLTFSNIREIADNATKGGDEAQSGGAAEPAPAPKAESPAQDAKAADAEGGKKVVIDRVVITGTKIQWGHVAVPLPEIEIKDIGKAEDGATEEGVFKTIVDAICDAADTVCAGAGAALKLAIEGAGAVKDGVGAVLDGAGSILGGGADGAAAAASAGLDAVKGGVDAVKGGVDSVKGGVNAVKGLFK